ncbi:F0F1 ATP synthase subunit gamma [Atopobacter sp. AH10]|uniref:F0F1 ATP synthase subunit gamma n=1 Tax=Atopobacter sp. AH10 TaxID=2315861 RepID=UPI000EF1FF0B|nr:F0F1 ATP synthase subunit gamma [Atopobacter sp. AH10]RLK64093.1 F0F1 ATP synthase subunit gamma [Atopobacter sp. AH10]
MGASLTETKTRIASTKKTSQITAAMQMVSASKLMKSEGLVRKYENYAKHIREMVLHLVYANRDKLLMTSNDPVEVKQKDSDDFLDYHDLLITRPVRRTAYLIISSDQGLAGSYNSSIFSSTLEMLERDHQNDPASFLLMTIGQSGSAFFKRLGYEVAYDISGLSDQPSFTEVRSIIVKAVSLYRSGEFDELYVCYNHHVNALVSNFRVEKMLPLVDIDEPEDNHSMKEVDYILEPSQEEILEQLLPQYAESLIYGAILDAKTAEHASRMTAMRMATDNAHQLVDDLTIQLNRRRQAQITQEITEIVGGASALEEND